MLGSGSGAGLPPARGRLKGLQRGTLPPLQGEATPPLRAPGAPYGANTELGHDHIRECSSDATERSSDIGECSSDATEHSGKEVERSGDEVERSVTSQGRSLASQERSVMSRQSYAAFREQSASQNPCASRNLSATSWSAKRATFQKFASGAALWRTGKPPPSSSRLGLRAAASQRRARWRSGLSEGPGSPGRPGREPGGRQTHTAHSLEASQAATLSCQPDTLLSDNVPLIRLAHGLADSGPCELASLQQDSLPEVCLAKFEASSGLRIANPTRTLG